MKNRNIYGFPKGTLLYRTSFFRGPLVPTNDRDTGKVGLYFATVPSIALGMAIEYKANMYYMIFKLTKDLRAIKGKYDEYVLINPERHFDKNGNRIFDDVETDLATENVNHFAADIYPVIDDPYIWSRRGFMYDENQSRDGELFINKDDLRHVKLLETRTVDWRKIAMLWKQRQPFSRKESFKEAWDTVRIRS